MNLLKLMLKVGFILPRERSTPNSKNSTIIKILIQSIKDGFMMYMSTIPQKINSLSISIFRLIIFGEGKFLNIDNIILKFDEPIRLQY